MANFPVHHGITLAQNSYVENLVVERLAADPVPVEAGRVWYNTTDKKFRQSTLDALGAVIVRTFATEEELVANIQGALDAEVTARQAADATLQANIAAEATARQLADTTLQANIDAEAAARQAADSTLQANIAAEATARAAADATLQANIDAEATARADGDQALQESIDAEATARQLADTTLQANIDALAGQVTALGNAFNYVGALTGGATSGTAFDLDTLPDGQKDAGDYYKVTTAGYFTSASLESPIYANIGDGLVFNITGTVDKIDNTDSNVAGTTDEISVTGSADTGFVVGIDTAFKNRVSTLESGFATEATARAAADSTLQANIDAEAAARQAADSTLQANIDAEATARAAADSTLQANIGTLSSLTTTDKTSIVSAINEINAQVAGGTEAVRDAYDATVWTYESSTPATTHTLAHNLNSGFVDFSVMIQRGDGNWYNDIASVAVVDANSATLYLSTALNVKVIARSAAKLGLVA